MFARAAALRMRPDPRADDAVRDRVNKFSNARSIRAKFCRYGTP
jgi:hypothetical protein